MMIKLAWNNLRSKSLNTFLCWMALSVSIGMISMLLIVEYNFEKNYLRNIEGIDMVLGAKGSPLQLILSAVYHIDHPTGNISYEEAEKWVKHPHIEKAISLAYGDSYEGISIVGSSEELMNHYQVNIETGKVFSENFQVVAGAKVAQKLKMKPGDSFFSTHGNDSNGEKHTHQAYTVTGILAASGTVLDNLIVSNLESVWNIHDHAHHEHHDDEEEHEYAHHSIKEITAVLIKFKNPMGQVQMPRMINEQTSMMAAVPAIEINRLFSLFGVGINVLQQIGTGVMLLATFIVFVTLYNSLKERKYELALMRSVGITREKILLSVIAESMFLIVAGLITGLLTSRLLLLSITDNVAASYQMEWNQLWWLVDGEHWLVVTVLLLGLLAALIPAIKVWTINISKTLANG
jgi:putative ABC transport system permease protein